MNCEGVLFTPIRWSCRQLEFYDAAARSVNGILLKDVSPAGVAALSVVCIVGVIVVMLFAFKHQR